MKRKSDLVRVIIGVLLCWVPFAIVLISTILWWDYVVGDISTQWSGGEVSNSAPAWTALLMPFCVSLVCSVIATVSAIDGVGPGLRQAYFWSFGIGSMVAVCWIGIMAPNVFRADDPPMPGWLIFAPLVILVGFVPWAIAGRGEPLAAASEISERVSGLQPVAPDSRVWTGNTWSPMLLLACGGIGAFALAMGIFGFFQGDSDAGVISTVVALVILFAGATFTWLTVAVDDRGLRVRSAIGIRLKQVPLNRIRAVDATVISAMAWGGIGYRVGPEGTALISRSGPALRVMTDAGSFFVSLDRADEAVIVLEDAIARVQNRR